MDNDHTRARGLIITLAIALGAGILWAVLLFTSSGCNNLAPCYRTVSTIAKARKQITESMAATCKVERNLCGKYAEEHKTKCLDGCQRVGSGITRRCETGCTTAKKEYLVKCLKSSPCYGALKDWAAYGKPGAESGEDLLWGTCEAIRSGKDKGLNWIEKARAPVCALLSATLKWRNLIGKKAQSVVDLLQSVKAVACN